MTTQCQGCAARSTLFLCSSCQGKLESLLQGLYAGPELFIGGTVPTGERTQPLLEGLADAAHGQTRLGVSVRRSTDHSGPLPFNERACELLEQAEECLYRWVTAINLNNETLGEP